MVARNAYYGRTRLLNLNEIGGLAEAGISESELPSRVYEVGEHR